jgi:hypothetical protein
VHYIIELYNWLQLWNQRCLAEELAHAAASFGDGGGGRAKTVSHSLHLDTVLRIAAKRVRETVGLAALEVGASGRPCSGYIVGSISTAAGTVTSMGESGLVIAHVCQRLAMCC